MSSAHSPVVGVELKPQARTASRRPRLGRFPVHVIVIGLMLVWALPAIALLVSSFRPASEVTQSGWWTAFFPPATFTFQNYTDVLSAQGLGNSFLNSLIITIPATIMVIAVAAFAAYAFSWMDFPGRQVLFVVVVGLLVVPLQVTLIPVLSLFRDFELPVIGRVSGTFLAVWLAHTGYGLPFAVYLLRNYIGGLPKEVFESASIDGAGPATSFFRLALPMSVPVIAALVIFQFLWVWNDLLVALVYLGPTPTNHPMSVTLANLTTSQGGDWQLLTAAAFVSMALPIIVFFSLQRYFVRGITGGAVKG
jgi:alpha-glucoside transport system permease protein